MITQTINPLADTAAVAAAKANSDAIALKTQNALNQGQSVNLSGVTDSTKVVGTTGPISYSGLSTPTTPINLPPASTDKTDYSGLTSGVTSQANTASSATPYSDTAKSIIDRVTALQNTDLSKTADTQTANTAAGVDTANATIKSISDQIKAISANATAQKIALQGTGNGVPTSIIGGQQAQIDRETAIKTLTLGTQLSAAQGDLAQAQTQAQQVIDLKYNPIETEIAQKTSQLNLIKPFLDVEQKAIADAQQAKLDAAKTDLADKKSQQRDLVNAAQSAGDNQTAFSALALDPSSPTYSKDLATLQLTLKDPIKALNIQKAQLDITNQKLQNQKLQNDIAAANDSGSNVVSVVNDNGNIDSVPTIVAPYYNVASNGVKYVDASTLQGTAKQKTDIINAAQAAGYKVITNKNTAADLVNIKDAKAKLDTVDTIMSGIGQPGWLARTLGGYFGTRAAQIAESDPQKAASGALESIGLDILKAISGVQGFRGNQTAVQQVTDHLPKVTDTIDTINQKVDYIKQLINDRETAAVGKAVSPTATQPDQVVNGVTYSYSASDGLYYPKK